MTVLSASILNTGSHHERRLLTGLCKAELTLLSDSDQITIRLQCSWLVSPVRLWFGAYHLCNMAELLSRLLNSVLASCKPVPA